MSHLLQMRGLKPAYRLHSHHRTKSHLLQMRGLKPLNANLHSNIFVASFTDAWIETLILISASNLEWSHLLQMRGLKQAHEVGKDLNTVSHLLQMRGLKLFRGFSLGL